VGAANTRTKLGVYTTGTPPHTHTLMSQMDAEYKKLTLSLKLRLTPKSTDSNRQLLTRLLLVMQFTLIQYLDTSAKMLIGIWTFVSLSEQPGLPVTQHTSSKVPLMP